MKRKKKGGVRMTHENCGIHAMLLCIMMSDIQTNESKVEIKYQEPLLKKGLKISSRRHKNAVNSF